MRFPVRIKHRRQRAIIYGKTPSYTFYRVSARIAGRRVVRPFSNCSAAREYAERSVRELERVDQSTALSPQEATDALAIRTVLEPASARPDAVSPFWKPRRATRRPCGNRAITVEKPRWLAFGLAR